MLQLGIFCAATWLLLCIKLQLWWLYFSTQLLQEDIHYVLTWCWIRPSSCSQVKKVVTLFWVAPNLSNLKALLATKVFIAIEKRVDVYLLLGPSIWRYFTSQLLHHHQITFRSILKKLCLSTHFPLSMGVQVKIIKKRRCLMTKQAYMTENGSQSKR